MMPVMSRPFLLAQLSDFHIGAVWAEGDPLARLAAAVESVKALPTQPDAVLVSGDLSDNATDAEYEQVRELLAQIQAPAYVLPGNHDDRRALHRHFGVPGADGEPVQYSVDLGPLRLDFAPNVLELVDEPAAFAVHALVDGELVSHVQPVE